ncbi:hypothetical protein F9U64_14255 [Gracilibacillus oryzae]|uniref:Lipoprotein n=1 Tax=Gracilibacillus oryzae TaxID=1672701 RepID=A0A7C8GSR1_9BACI|nr:hypothetical protein [Gracilibacillus oryzae]KAB8130503.1 hypothetical protein F9U64_14255 [Gracilibacillus oryzae]
MNKYLKLLIFTCAVPLILLAACGNEEEVSNNNKVTETTDSIERQSIILSTARDFATEQENETVEHPESEQDYQIVKIDEEKQIIISDFTGRVYKNTHFVSGSFIQNDTNYNYEIILSWADADFNEPLLLKYSSDTGTNYTLEEASVYFVEEDTQEDLEVWDYEF